MMRDTNPVARERLEAIAYLALWELRDLEPGAEPAPFKATRLILHERIDEPDAAPTSLPGDAPRRANLALVRR